jgi:4-hydroxybenzoate polyprenyltransferase
VSNAQSIAGIPNPTLPRLGGWLTLARISNAPTVASNVLAGGAVAGSLEPSASVGLLAVAMVAFYTAGMLLNDVCDFAWDTVHRPDRPLVQGVVSRSAALTATTVLFVIGSVMLWLIGLRPLLSGLVLIGCIVVYDTWHKSNPLSPVIMAACRLLVYVTAFVAFAWPPTPMLFIAGGLLVVHLIGLTALAKSESRPTVIGYWPTALLALPPLYFAVQVPLLAIAEAAWVGYSVSFVYRQTERRIGAAIARLIAGISLVDLLVLAAVDAPPLMLGLALIAFLLTLLLQRYVEGT